MCVCVCSVFIRGVCYCVLTHICLSVCPGTRRGETHTHTSEKKSKTNEVWEEITNMRTGESQLSCWKQKDAGSDGETETPAGRTSN